MSTVIGITMGDPCGVGPEISVRALSDMSDADRAQTRIYGNLVTLEAARDALGLEIDLAHFVVALPVEGAPLRSDERRVGKECGRECRSRGSTFPEKKICD